MSAFIITVIWGLDSVSSNICESSVHFQYASYFRLMIMLASDPYPTFNLFLNLPPELRYKIWLNVLLTLKPSIYLYHRGCWRHRLLDLSDEWYGLDDEGPPVSFRLELVKKI